MRKKLLLLALFLFWAVPAFAQEIDSAWVRRYNGPADTEDVAQAIAVDASGNVYVTGYSWGNGSNYDYATIRYSAAGDTVWVRRYNGPQNNWDQAHALALDGSGNIYVTGGSRGLLSSEDYATIKYYPNGDTAWLRRYNGTGNANDRAYAIAVDASANVYVTGASADTSFKSDYTTIKYDSNGDTAWVQRYNGPGNDWDFAYAIAVDGSGNVYVTGLSYGSGTGEDYCTIKYKPNGDTAWVRRYNGPGNAVDRAGAIAVDGSNNVYVTGYSVGGSGTGEDYATIKYYPNGDTAWVRRYNGPADTADLARAIAVDGSGNVYVTGLSYGSGTGEDYCTIKYKPNGDTAWVRRYNGPGNAGDDAHAIAVDGAGNVYVTGESFGSGANYDYATIKYDPDGYVLWEKRYNGPGNGQDHGYAMALDGFANVYVTGESYGIGTDYDYATIKYFQYVCGDANGDGLVDPVDRVYLFQYCFMNAPPPPINPASGDMDGYGSTTIRDIAYLSRYIFNGGPAPYCNPGSEYVPSQEPSDAVIVSPNLLPANDSTIAVTINYQNNSSIIGFALPLKVTIGEEIPVINTAMFSSRITNLSGLQAITIDSAQGTVNVGFCAGPSVLSPGSGIILTLNLSITPVAYDRQIQADTIRLAPFNYPMFIKQSNLAGVIPGYMLQDRNDTVLFIAYSPVNLIVTNPDGDSIELGFNNIPNATYDTTTDRNHDGHRDDIITIPNPVVGQYLVRVVTEPGGSGNYTCAVKLDGNEERVMIANAPAPGPGQVDTVFYNVPEYLHGDANRDGKKTVSDVVFLINYLFKGGPFPDPVNLGDVNFCKQIPPVEPGQPTVADVVYLINYLFKGGPPPCS